ncbi:MAG: serine/threonine-protein kinase [Kofleriaceae bacterium]
MADRDTLGGTTSTVAEPTVSRTHEGGETLRAGGLARGMTIDHYVVLECIGEGGMGVVYSAYDYTLDRKVALKLMHETRGLTGRQRLVREARALAKLSHPNVVTVYEVGRHADELFVAMELVEGVTVRAWSAEMPRSWREVVAVFRRAGEGLAAAHAAGVIHRDIKPDNIFIDDAGAVRVGDFGVAMLRGGEPDDEAGTRDSPVMLTRPGATVGTPAYMAPEQLRGDPEIDGRADQFGFCVALHEALYGERPFAGETEGELLAASDRGQLRDPADRAVPGWLRRIVVRGLAARPDDRYPSISELVAALGGNPRATTLRWSLVGGALALIAVGVAGVTLAADAKTLPCRDAERRLAGIWDAPRRAAIHAAFLASSAPIASDTWSRVDRVLDGKARALTAMRTEACEATHVRGEQSAALLDLRMECLDNHLADLRALTDVFLIADAATVATAATAARAVEGPEACANAIALRDGGQQASDPAAPARRERLAQIRAQLLTGKDASVLALGKALVTEAVAVGDRRVEAAVQTAIGGALVRRRELAGAEAALYRAIAAAAASHDGRVAARAWLDLVSLATERVHYDEAHRIALATAGAIENIGGDPPLEGSLAESLGVLYQREGKLAEARAQLQRAISILERHYGRDHYRLATPLQRLAGVAQAGGSRDEAVLLSRRAREGLAHELGPDAPEVLTLRFVEGAALLEAGKPTEAMASFQRTLADAERTKLSDRRVIAMPHMNMGIIQRDAGRLAEARAFMQRAIAIHTEVSGPDSLAVAKTRSSLAFVLIDLGRLDDALAELERTITIQDKLLGPDHPTLALALGLRGTVWMMKDDAARGLGSLERAVSLTKRAGQACDPNLCFWLARALTATGGDRSRARALLTEARAGYAAAGNAEGTAAVNAWVARSKQGARK